MSTVKQWLLDDAELHVLQQQFAEEYFGRDGHIFNSPHGAGYWLYPIAHHSRRGWLAFEYDESTFDADDVRQHAVAKRAWKQYEDLPANYFALTPDVVASVFKNGLRKWGQEWIDSIDLPSTEEALQGTILGEQRYG